MFIATSRVTKRFLVLSLFFAMALFTDQSSAADWWASAEDGWCYHTEPYSLCLPDTFELERVTASSLKFADRTGVNHSYFATIYSQFEQDEIVNSYIDDTFQMETHDQYDSLSVWRYGPSASIENTHRISVIIFFIGQQFTIVIHGRNTHELDSLSDSILKQLQVKQ